MGNNGIIHIEHADFCVYEILGSVDHAGLLKVGDTTLKSPKNYEATKGKPIIAKGLCK